MILNRLAEDLDELAIVEQRPQQDGRNMTMMLGPGKAATEAKETKPTARSRAAPPGRLACAPLPSTRPACRRRRAPR